MIQAVDLRRTFGGREAVAGIRFEVRRGQIYGLFGPHGAGKTTTIRMLAGRINSSGGRARVAGREAMRDWPYLKTLIGLLFEEQGLYDAWALATTCILAAGCRAGRNPGRMRCRRWLDWRIGAKIASRPCPMA
jgi:ABC-2 type transport system ATP-binding protein